MQRKVQEKANNRVVRQQLIQQQQSNNGINSLNSFNAKAVIQRQSDEELDEEPAKNKAKLEDGFKQDYSNSELAKLNKELGDELTQFTAFQQGKISKKKGKSYEGLISMKGKREKQVI